MPGEFADHATAVEDYRDSTDPHLVARLIGELHELLALDLDGSDYAVAVAELGMEVDPPAPYSPDAWLARVADLLIGPGL
ncbi:contact-dependent growth inhibition system immunity protein [Streptomyces sp. NPDC056580]|uniref:contact-dependent growth inhibition system immunity protein n=1 Tax=Streptomyces sp. NPDC056580 TaxID=3345872 RepID=UPI0036939D9D